MNTKTILVVGATGKQGGATVSTLLSHNYNVRTITRNPASPSSKALEAQGVQIFKADLLDKTSLVDALTGCDSAFLVTDSRGPNGSEDEIRQGKNFLDAAKQAGVGHIVYTSVQSADKSTGVPHFDSKWEIEQHVYASGLDWTITRPTGFMEMIPLDGFAARAGMLGLLSALLGSKKLQWISVGDIGLVAAKALMHPEEFKSKVIDLAGDELSVTELQDLLIRVTGQAVWKLPLPRFLASRALPVNAGIMMDWLAAVGYTADITEVRRHHPEVLTFEQYIRKSMKA